MRNFDDLKNSFTPTIFSWDYFCDFEKIKKNSFSIKIQLNILNSLFWEADIENKFLQIIKTYPETRKILPILIATRDFNKDILNKQTYEIVRVSDLININKNLDEKEILNFFNETWLKKIFENKYITNLEDYIFGVETWLDSNWRKNRTGILMENIVEEFIKKFCENNQNFSYLTQATTKEIKNKWNIDILSDKSARRFDFAIFDFDSQKIFLIETNYFSSWWSKLKAVAGEFTWLYEFMKKQNIDLFWVTDWLGWSTALKPLEDAFEKMTWNIYNIEMLKKWILNSLLWNND